MEMKMLEIIDSVLLLFICILGTIMLFKLSNLLNVAISTSKQIMAFLDTEQRKKVSCDFESNESVTRMQMVKNEIQESQDIDPTIQKYWLGFIDYLISVESPLMLLPKEHEPYPAWQQGKYDYYLGFEIGTSGFWLAATLYLDKNKGGTHLRWSEQVDKAKYFTKLMEVFQQDVLDIDPLGVKTIKNESDEANKRIGLSFHIDFSQESFESDYREMHDYLQKLEQVFAEPVKKLENIR